MSTKTALIIGAGPAGLTAAYELLLRTDIRPVVLEKSEYMGGISRTVNYKGNRMDIGGHRFFSKSDRVMNWWMNVMPIEARDVTGNGTRTSISYQNKSREVAMPASGPSPDATDRVMLIRHRKSRIYFLRRFFDYPIKLSKETLVKLGLARTVRIGISYMRALAMQIKPEKSLEEFLVNRFGRELYLLFFKSYTEKVWGVPCNQISAEWGAQRIKGLSITKAITHFVKSTFSKKKTADIQQKDTETSLIEQFMYPKLGPGQLWEYVAETVQKKGGCVLTGWNVETIHVEGNRVGSVVAVHKESGERRSFEADYFFSTMPVQELIRALNTNVPDNVRQVSEGLMYRDFITVGLLLKRLQVRDDNSAGLKLLTDNWIYIQEPDVLVGRMQIFNNWSPYMVADPKLIWIGLEYFCYDTDELWKKSDQEMIALAKEEVERIGIISQEDVVDATVIRMPKTYPAYFGTYDRFGEIRDYVNGFENLFLVGRNGMHKYNNQDHSMLTAMTAVDNIAAGITDKSNLWAVNTEMEYHEEKENTETQSKGTGAANQL
jgi:protoporphyrinogen oxidase